jgi:hypothetical protein
MGVRFPGNGPVAQLGARLNGIQEVTGSIPVRSTTFLILQKTLNGKRLGGSIGEFALAVKR